MANFKWNRQYSTECPCRDCARRHPCCHDDCQEYKEFVESNTEYREGIRKRLYNNYILSRTKPRRGGGR